MANYKYIEETGVIVPDTTEIKQQVQEEYKNALGQDLDISDSTPQGRLIEVETISRKRIIEDMALIANMLNPNKAFGIFLDSLTSLFGIERVGATSTRVLCQLTGMPKTVIPYNSQAKDINGKIYYSESNITLDNSGEGQGYFLSEEKGAIECQANTLNQIVTGVIGWETINNSTAGVVGVDEESDSTLRKKISIEQFIGIALLKAIQSAVMRVKDVEDCLVVDNPTGTPDIISIPGITIPAHSLFICVDGGVNSEVAKAIFDTKSGGCGYTTGTGHTQTVDIVEEISGRTYSVSFDRPIYQEIDVEVRLATGQATQIVIKKVKQAILDYSKGKIYGLDGLSIGKNVSPFEIASAINQELSELYIKSVKIAKHSQTATTNEIVLKPNERATIVETDISVL